MSPPTYVTLNTGAKIPTVALGTYEAEGNSVYDAVLYALKNGYRHIDTAFIYKNEPDVGRAIRDSGVPREEIFVTTKAWLTHFRDIASHFDDQLKRLGLDYVDLYLVHWPVARIADPKDEFSFGTGNDDYPVAQVWEQFQKLPKTKAKAIGVSNFTIKALQALLDAPTTTVVPAVNQVELHPELPQQKLVDFDTSKGIVTEAYTPLAKGVSGDVVKAIAEKHKADPGQVVLSWNVLRNVVVLPKSTTPSRIDSNLKLIDLDAEDIKQLTELGKTPRRIVDPDFNGVKVFDNNADSF